MGRKKLVFFYFFFRQSMAKIACWPISHCDMLLCHHVGKNPIQQPIDIFCHHCHLKRCSFILAFWGWCQGQKGNPSTGASTLFNHLFTKRGQCFTNSKFQCTDWRGLWSPHLFTSCKKHQNVCNRREKTARKGLCLLRGFYG